MRTANATVTAVLALAIAAWALTTHASYAFVSHFAHIRPVTTVETDAARGRRADRRDAAARSAPIAGILAADGMHASFGLTQASGPADSGVLRYGDQALPRLPNGGLVRWMGARGELHKLVGPMGLHHHFYYTSTGPEPRAVAGRPRRGRPARGRGGADHRPLDPLGHLHPGEVIELRITNVAEAQVLLARLRLGLEASHLRAVHIGRLMRDAAQTA